MIQSVFKRNEAGRVVSFELKGHAEAGPYGSDIVCAGVSALAINAINSIDSLAGFEPIVDSKEDAGGYLYVEILQDITQEQMNIAQILLESLLLGLKSIEIENSEFIHMETIQTARGGAQL